MIHDAGIIHGNLTAHCLVFNRKQYQSLDVSIVGFGRAKTPGFDHPEWPPRSGVANNIMKEMKEERQKLRALIIQAPFVRENISQSTFKKAKEVGKVADVEPAVKKTLYHGRIRH